MTRRWVPQPGEIVRLDFNPVAGHEQGNARPAIVLSHAGFNERSGLLVCVPCTSKIKGFPFEVAIAGLAVPTVALAHQLRTVDWRERAASPLGFASMAEMSDLRQKIQALLGM